MREARGWTQEHLAMVAGIETRTVQRVERDSTKNADTLQAIASAFDVAVASLRTTWLIPERRLLRTHFVDSHERFLSVQENYPSHASARTILAPLTDEGYKQVDDLLDLIFADRELIEPYETELWKLYAQQIEEPLTSLFALKLAIFILDERRDLRLPKNGFLNPEKPYIDDWRMEHFLVVPRHGCFQMSPTAPVHRFNENRSLVCETVFRSVTQEDVGLHVFANTLVAYRESTSWCDVCFPVLPNGWRISMDYIEEVTGLTRAKLYALYEETMGGQFLNGLA